MSTTNDGLTAKRARYSERTTEKQGCRLLRNVEVRRRGGWEWGSAEVAPIAAISGSANGSSFLMISIKR